MAMKVIPTGISKQYNKTSYVLRPQATMRARRGEIKSMDALQKITLKITCQQDADRLFRMCVEGLGFIPEPIKVAIQLRLQILAVLSANRHIEGTI